MNLKITKATIDTLKETGIQFSEGLTETELRKIEELYDIIFPESLRRFYALGVPVSENEHEFPLWCDFSDANIAKIKERITAPLRWLLLSVQTDFWLPDWGERAKTVAEAAARFEKISRSAPRLIPIYSHRYMPMLDGVGDPPVISTVGSDIIYYGADLYSYLQNEFINKGHFPLPGDCARIPFWSDIIEGQNCYFDKLES